MMNDSQARRDAGKVVAEIDIVCAWCQQHIDSHQVEPPTPFTISYSICGRCYDIVARDFPGRTPRDV